jgi:hypothetical protein
MTKRLDRLLFVWIPVLALYLYAFNAILEVNAIKAFFNALPLWGWLIGYLVIMALTKVYLKSFSIREDEKTDDYTARTMRINSDIIIVFIFSVISFVLVMLLLGNSLSSAMNLMG